MRIVKYGNRFRRDYRREKSGVLEKRLNALLMEVVDLLAADQPLLRRHFDHQLAGFSMCRKVEFSAYGCGSNEPGANGQRVVLGTS